MRDAMPGRLSFDRVAAIYDETRGLAPRAMARVLAVLADQLQGKRESAAQVKKAGPVGPHPGFPEAGLLEALAGAFGIAVGHFGDARPGEAVEEDVGRRMCRADWDDREDIPRGGIEPLRAKWKGKE